MLARTGTVGRARAGNRTFLIRLPPVMSTLADSDRDEENHVQGRMPQNMKSAYGSRSLSPRSMTKLKTKLEMRGRSSGLRKDQKNPRTEPRYRAFSSRATRL